MRCIEIIREKRRKTQKQKINKNTKDNVHCIKPKNLNSIIKQDKLNGVASTKKQLNFYILPSCDKVCHVLYNAPSVNCIDWSAEDCNFLSWCKTPKDDSHHWFPSEAIRFMTKICKNENIPYDINESIELTKNFGGKDLQVWYPKGEFSYSDYQGNKKEGDYNILYDNDEPSMYESLFIGRCTVGTLINKHPKNDLKVLLICDSMCHQIIVNMITACKMITWVDNRKKYDLSKIHVNTYDIIIAVTVNAVTSKSSTMSKHVLRTLDYFAKQL